MSRGDLLLAVLGVDLVVLVAFAAVVFAPKRWVKRQPGAFHGVIRVADGEVDGLRPKRGRRDGHSVRDVLVWTTAPFMFRNELVPGCPSRPGTDMGRLSATVSLQRPSQYHPPGMMRQRP